MSFQRTAARSSGRGYGRGRTGGFAGSSGSGSGAGSSDTVPADSLAGLTLHPTAPRPAGGSNGKMTLQEMRLDDRNFNRDTVSDFDLFLPGREPTDLKPPPQTIREIRDMGHQKRNGTGRNGCQLEVLSNNYRLSIPGNTLRVDFYTIQFVEVDFEGNEVTKPERAPKDPYTMEDKFDMFWKYVAGHREFFDEPCKWAFDGCAALLTVDLGKSRLLHRLQPRQPEGVRAPRVAVHLASGRRHFVDVKLRYAGGLDLNLKEAEANLTEGMRAEGTGEALPALTTVQCLQNIMHQFYTNPLVRKQHSILMARGKKTFYFDPDRLAVLSEGVLRPLDLKNNREMRYGVYMGLKAGQDGLFLTVDRTASAFLRPTSGLQFLCDALNAALGTQEFVREGLTEEMGVGVAGFQPRFFKILSEQMKGVKIICTVPGGGEGTRVAREVTKMDDKGCRVTTFHWSEICKRKSGQQRCPGPKYCTVKEALITVEKYYMERYDYKLKHPNLPMVVCGRGSRKTYFPIELVQVVENQLAKKTALGDDANALMIRKLATSATERRNEIEGLRQAEQGIGRDAVSKAFNIQLEARMLTQKARRLDAPRISYGHGRFASPQEGSWKTGGMPMAVPKTIRCYGIISFVPIMKNRDNYTIVRRFVEAYPDACHPMGMQLMKREPVDLYELTRADDIPAAIDQMRADERATDPRTQESALDLVFVIYQGRSPYEYSLVKLKGDVTGGIATQGVLWKTMKMMFGPNSRPQAHRDTLMNINFKVNVKLGGINHVTSHTVLDDALKAMPTLFLGIDVSHPERDDLHGPSYASVVGNVDRTGAIFGATVRLQRKRREVVTYVADAIRERVLAFTELNGVRPQRVIIFRDGVCDSMLDEILREEVACAKRAFEFFERDYNPKLTVIVVDTHHHVRIFPVDETSYNCCGRAKNVRPGTVVDTEICHSHDFDWYMVSQFGIQGTSRPAHYYVLYDEGNYEATFLQQLAFDLTHVYARCPRSTSVPAPVYYADLAAARAKIHASVGGPSGTGTTPSPPPSTAGGSDATGDEDESRASSRTTTIQLQERVTPHVAMARTMYYC